MKPDDLSELGADLYQEHLLDHYKNPRNAGRLEPADIDHDGDNPTCGDMIHVYAKLAKDGRIDEIRFMGKGCAISQASASILYEELKGKRVEEVKRMNIQNVQELIGITLRPARVKCADLGLVVLKEGIKEFETKGATKKALPGFGS
jgi:nitrogen fixation protein NifU and related proteins